MDPQAVRTIASDIVLISIGLLAATLIVMSPAWKRFRTCWEQTSSEGRKVISRGVLLVLGIIFLFLLPLFIALWINPYGWYYDLPYIAFLLTIVVICVLFPISAFLIIKRLWNKLRNRPSPERTMRPDFTQEICVSVSLVLFIFTVFLLIFTMYGAIDAAISVNVSLDPDSQRKNFEFARAMVRLVPGIFFCGLLFLGVSYIMDIKSRPELDARDD